MEYLRRWIENYDVAILSCKEVAQEMKPQQRVMMLAINPFTIKNRPLNDFPLALRQGIVELIHDKESRDEMGQQGARDCSEKFSADALPRTIS